MNILVYSSDMGSLDQRLSDLRVGDRLMRHYNRYGSEIAMGGYEYATLVRIDDGHIFRVRVDKLDEHFELESIELENDSSL